MIVHQESLEYALHIAISVQAQREIDNDFRQDSALLATWRKALLAVQAGDNLELNPDTISNSMSILVGLQPSSNYQTSCNPAPDVLD